jgi:hypothetical protein
MTNKPQDIPLVDAVSGSDAGMFWHIEKSKIEVHYEELKNFLHLHGFRKYKGDIVRIENNIVSIVEPDILQVYILNKQEKNIRDKWAALGEKVVKNITPLIHLIDENFLRDTADVTYLYYKNCIVKITSDAIAPLPYKDIAGYIWQTQIRDREFSTTAFAGSDFERFIQILAGAELDYEFKQTKPGAKFPELCRLIGFMISGYKDPGLARAPVITENLASDDSEDGGGGKGKILDCIAQVRNVVNVNAKNYDPKNPQRFGNISHDTHLIHISDCRQNFDFEGMQPDIDESITIKKMHKDIYEVKYADSPKIAFTSNFPVGKSGGPVDRRQIKFAIHKLFGRNFEPIQIFSKLFFSQWDKSEWNKFDNFMSFCAQSFLQNKDHKSMSNTTELSIERILIHDTRPEFIDYMDQQLANYFFDYAPDAIKIFTGEINGVYYVKGVDIQMWYANVISNKPNRDYYITIDREKLKTKISLLTNYKNLTTNMVTKWLTKWCERRGVIMNPRWGAEKTILIMSIPGICPGPVITPEQPLPF